MRKYIHNVLSYTVAFQLSFSPLMASSGVDEIVARARPSREFSYVFVDSKNKPFAFKEYFIGTNGNNCFFNALGVTRENAIDAVTRALARGSERTRDLLDKAIEDQIHESAFEGLQALPQTEKRAAYLEKYRSSTLMIECAQKIGQTRDVANNIVTLFNVFAYVCRRNISVYKPSEEILNRLDAYHITHHTECAQPTLHLLLKGSHFNRLVSNARSETFHVEALRQENLYLEELRVRAIQEQADTPLPRDDDGAPRTTPITTSREEILSFLLRKIPTLGALTYEQSQEQAWDASSSLPSLYERFAGKTTLILDYGFTPRAQRREDAIQDLIIRAPRSLPQEKQSHQVKIYLGRLLMTQGRFDNAWQYLHETLLNRKFSQAGRLYMAQMILEHDYRPPHISDPIAYVQELLTVLHSRPPSSKRTSTRTSTLNLDLHNPYLTQRTCLDTISALTQMTEGHERPRTKASQASHAANPAVTHGGASSASSSSTRAAHAGLSSSASSSSPKRTRQEITKENDESEQTTPSPTRENTPKRLASQHRMPDHVSTPGPSSPQSQDDSSQDESDFFSNTCPQPYVESETHRTAQTASPLTGEDDAFEDGAVTLFTRLSSRVLQAKALILKGDHIAAQTLLLEVFDEVNTASSRETDLTPTQQDYIKMNIFLRLGNNMFTGTLDGQHMTQSQCHLNALDFATRYGNLDVEMRAWLGLGNAQYHGPIGEKRYTDTDCYLRALDLAKTNGNLDVEMRAWLGLGNAQYRGSIGGKRYTNTDCYLRALDLAKTNGNLDVEMRAWLGLGYTRQTHIIKGVRYTEHECYKTARDLAQRLYDTENKIRALMGMGRSSLVEHAAPYYVEAIRLCGTRFTDLRKSASTSLKNVKNFLARRANQQR